MTWESKVPPESLNEDRIAPAPWSYADATIRDCDGVAVLRGVRPAVGKRIVRAVNKMATEDGILS